MSIEPIRKFVEPEEMISCEDLTVEQIKELIPHRYPMLMIEKLTEIVPFESAVGIKCVSVNEPFFEGHFPGKPVMPGVLIVEAMAQTAAALVMHSMGDSSGKLVYFMSIEEARFRRPVVPGDYLKLHVQKIQNRRNVWKFEGKAYVDEQLVSEASFMAMIMDE